MPELLLSLKFWHIFLFLTDTESYEVDTQCIFRESILMIICEKCTKRGISIYADWKCLFFVLLFPFFLQLRKFSIMTFSASASVMPSVLSFNSCSSLIRPIAASWMIAASTCFASISGIEHTCA